MSNERYLAFASFLECAYLAGTLLQSLDIFLVRWTFPDGTEVDEYCLNNGAKCSPVAYWELTTFAIAYSLMFNLVPTILLIRATMLHASIFSEGQFQDISTMTNSNLIKVLGMVANIMRCRLLVFVLLAISYLFELSVLGTLSILNVQQFTARGFTVKKEWVVPGYVATSQEEAWSSWVYLSIALMLIVPYFLVYTTRALVQVRHRIQK